MIISFCALGGVEVNDFKLYLNEQEVGAVPTYWNLCIV